ncbi:hypothetical protein BKI51_10380 [Alphaproteobacteria bacterium AO1-B]|nr:hypothetical protein BKI51_10380 [Alphaproteobacteria bacterium AO1-B]
MIVCSRPNEPIQLLALNRSTARQVRISMPKKIKARGQEASIATDTNIQDTLKQGYRLVRQ